MKATKVAKGLGGRGPRSIMSITRDAKVSLKHVHIRMEDTGVPGPNSLAWEAPAIATGLIVGSLEIRKSDQPADSSFPNFLSGTSKKRKVPHPSTTPLLRKD